MPYPYGDKGDPFIEKWWPVMVLALANFFIWGTALHFFDAAR